MTELYPVSYHTLSPVLFVVFNRPDTTERVFEQIRKASPRKLYIAADGPRTGIATDPELCRRTREIVSRVDWNCDVKMLFRDENAGCRDGVSSAVDWFFSHEDQGIILEDDCLPADSFFWFCDILLEKYKHDTRVRHITGCNLQMGRKWGNASYYFSNMTHVWGWASWKRAWKDYDKGLKNFRKEEIARQLRNVFDEPLIVESYQQIFDDIKAGKINAWGYQLDFTNYFNNGLTIIPNENLISNIGFRADATHTLDEKSVYANIPAGELNELTHPIFILPQKRADMTVLYRDFDIEARKRKARRPGKKIKAWAKALLKQAAAFTFIS